MLFQNWFLFIQGKNLREKIVFDNYERSYLSDFELKMFD